jgi:PST family polysaccharide transporter
MSAQEVLGRGVASYLIKKDNAPTTVDLRNTFGLQHSVGLVLSVLVAMAAPYAAAWYGRRELVILFAAAAVASYAYAWRSVPVALLERDFRYSKVALVEILESLIFSATAILFAWQGYAITGLALAVILRSVFPTVLVYGIEPVRPAFVFQRRTISAVADFGLAVAASSLINIAILLVPVLLVGKLAGLTELGMAQMAFALYANFLFVTAAILRLSFSTYSRLPEYPGELRSNVIRHLEMLAVVMVPGIVCFAGLSPHWTPWIFGSKWQGLPELLFVLAPGYFFASVFWGILNPALLVSGKHRQVFLWLVAFAVVYASLTWMLTPRYGAKGVVMAFSAVEFALYPVLFYMYSKLHGPLPYRKVFGEMALGATFLAVLWTSARQGWIAAVLITFSYLVVWFVRNSGIFRILRPLIRTFAETT